MKPFLISFILLACLGSCMDYATKSVIDKAKEKTALQDFYSPCCGSCGERIVIDSLGGIQYALQINCDIEGEHTTRCTPNGVGTQKHVIVYKKKKVVSETIYKPVFDTVELKRLFPSISREEYYDSSLSSRPILPLTRVDSLLIEKFFVLSDRTTCKGEYIRLIRGFKFVREIAKPFLIDNKKVSFKIK